MSLYGRSPGRRQGGRQPAGDNFRWKDIERAKARIDGHANIYEHLTANQVNFIRDLFARGPNYNLSQKQHQYLTAVLAKVPRD